MVLHHSVNMFVNIICLPIIMQCYMFIVYIYIATIYIYAHAVTNYIITMNCKMHSYITGNFLYTAVDLRKPPGNNKSTLEG